MSEQRDPPVADVQAAIQAAKQRLQSQGKATDKGLLEDQMTINDFLDEPDDR